MTKRLLILVKIIGNSLLQRENALRLHSKDHLIKTDEGIVFCCESWKKKAQFVRFKSGGIYSRIIRVFLRVQHTKPTKQTIPRNPSRESLSS
jgi:hypothetical protein